MTISNSYKSLLVKLTLAAVDTHYTRRLYAGKVCRFNTLPAQPRGIAAIVVDIDSCCPTPWLKTKLKLKWNPLRLSFPHAAAMIAWRVDEWHSLAAYAAVGASRSCPSPSPSPCPCACVCLWPCPSAWLRASADPESMAQFWLAAVLAASVLQFKNERGPKEEGQKKQKENESKKKHKTHKREEGKGKWVAAIKRRLRWCCYSCKSLTATTKTATEAKQRQTQRQWVWVLEKKRKWQEGAPVQKSLDSGFGCMCVFWALGSAACSALRRQM